MAKKAAEMELKAQDEAVVSAPTDDTPLTVEESDNGTGAIEGQDMAEPESEAKAEELKRVVEVVWSSLNTDAARAAFRDELEEHVLSGMLPALAGQGGGQHFVILVRPMPMAFPMTVDEGV